MVEVVMGMLAGLKLAVFGVLAVFIYMADQSSDQLDLRKFYILALAFMTMAVIEAIYVLSLAQGSIPVKPLSVFEEFRNVELAMEILFLVGGLSVASFLRKFSKEVKAD